MEGVFFCTRSFGRSTHRRDRVGTRTNLFGRSSPVELDMGRAGDWAACANANVFCQVGRLRDDV